MRVQGGSKKQCLVGVTCARCVEWREEYCNDRVALQDEWRLTRLKLKGGYRAHAKAVTGFAMGSCRLNKD